MRRMMEDMDRMFEDFGFGPSLSPLLRGLGRQLPELGARLWSPQIEVTQREGRLQIRADLPGVAKDDINIELNDGALILRGERRREQQGEREGLHYTERGYGSFTRSIAIPRGVRAEDVEARFDSGVLEVSLELPEQMRSRAVPIKSGSSAASTSDQPSERTPAGKLGGS